MTKFKHFSALFVILIVASSISNAGQYSIGFERYLADHPAESSITAIITMADQVDLRALQAELSVRKADRREWHETVVRALQSKAAESQADLISVLENYVSQGLVSRYKPIWVGNIIIVTGSMTALSAIVARDDVGQVSLNLEISNINPIIGNDSLPVISRVEQGLRAIHADQAWAMGYNGAGRLVCNFDTGVDGYHPALYDRWRGFDSRYADNPEWAWCDPQTNTPFPFDSDEHGTHTMGIMCGLGESSGDTIGVAIGAEWISAGVIARRGYIEDILFAFQWATDPDGDPATVWDVPDVCSNSWGVDADCDETFWVAIDGCEAAGVVVLFAAGNDGPDERTLLAPADRASTELSLFAVGAVDHDNYIARFSSRGPTNCTPDRTDAIKPEISAPGVNIRSSVPGSRYEEDWSGTSMACPHVAGVIALMRQANPNLSTRQVKEILLQTADDLGLDGADNSYGSGLVNAYEAVMMALQYLDGWGTVAGVVTDMASGSPIAGARISVEDKSWDAITRPNGQYSIFVPSDSAWNVVVEHEPTHLPFHGVITAFSGDTVTQDFVLEPKVGITLTASFANPGDVSYRSFYIKGSWDNNGIYNDQWNGDQIEIKDNGIFPDLTPNDGIFTGRVLLARDQLHTFNWAVYSEDYGGEASRLQAGADFQVLTFIAPVVPVLAVNPSGNFSNWVITIDGDFGLHQDLTRGVNGRAARWGATVNLDSGMTYTFNFKVMHSEVASYGSGGIGGPVLRYTAPISAEHQVMFDDNDDSYLLQVTGTDGPPKFLTATSGLESSVPLIWLAPGAVESQEMRYDDGTYRHGYLYASSEVYMAEMFAPEVHPLAIDSVMIRVTTVGDPGWPLPDPNADPIGVAIFLEGENGMPEDSPVFYQEIQGNDLGWMKVDIDEIVVTEGNFWVAMRNIPGGYDEALGLDAETNYPANKWARVAGEWGLESHFPGDHMITAKILTAEQALVIGTGPNPISQVAAGVPVFNDSSQQLFVSDNFSTTAISNDIPDRTVFSPKVTTDIQPIIFDTEDLLGYNIYRSTAPAPFDRGLKDNPALIPGNSFNDRGLGLQGPLANGTTYYYQASAVYELDNGQHVEVGPSNQAVGVPLNLPPGIPQGLSGMASGDTAKLAWHPNSDQDVVAYRVYRCDYNQYEYHLAGTISIPDTSFSEVPPADGVYRYRISALDSGGLESVGFSNYVDVSIGLSYPRNVRASTDQDSSITLQWRRPGMSRQLNVLIMGTDPDDADSLLSEFFTFYDIANVEYYIPSFQDRPTPERLSPYDVIIVLGGMEIWDPGGTGDVLATYVESGGAVILSQMCYYTPYNILEGRIMTQYSPFSGGYGENRDVELGTFNHSHPIMLDVHMLTDFWGSVVNVINGGELVASYIDGVPFVAVHPNQKVVGINGYFGSYRRCTGDMMTVVRNATNYVCGNWEITPSYYRLYKAESPSGPFNMIAQVPGDSLVYTDSHVPNGVEFYYRLTAVYPGNLESNPTNSVIGHGLIGARAEITPSMFNISLPAGQSIDTTLFISNVGGISMDYLLELDLHGVLASGEKSTVGDDSNISAKSGAGPAEEPNDPPAIMTHGGPDAYGYTWHDSQEPEGPAFNFIDISDYGYELEDLHWDEIRGPYPIDYFEFPFYGFRYSTIYISSNGFISFTDNDRGMLTTALPDTNAPANLVAPFWNAFYAPGGGAAYYYSAGDSFIVMWEEIVDPWGRGPFTFEVILESTGVITFQYLALPTDYYQNTIGIQNYDKTIGLQISYNQRWLTSGRAIRIKPGWLTLDPIAASVESGQTASLEVHFSAKFLSEGIYTGTIIANTWDSYHSAPQISVPVTFNVQRADNIDEDITELPLEYALRQNYPNPFNPTTVIQYDLPKSGYVRIIIYNVLGQHVRTLVNSEQQAGYQSVVWDGTNEGGLPVSSGIYFYVLKAGDHSINKTMTLIR